MNMPKPRFSGQNGSQGPQLRRWAVADVDQIYFTIMQKSGGSPQVGRYPEGIMDAIPALGFCFSPQNLRIDPGVPKRVADLPFAVDNNKWLEVPSIDMFQNLENA